MEKVYARCCFQSDVEHPIGDRPILRFLGQLNMTLGAFSARPHEDRVLQSQIQIVQGWQSEQKGDRESFLGEAGSISGLPKFFTQREREPEDAAPVSCLLRCCGWRA